MATLRMNRRRILSLGGTAAGLALTALPRPLRAQDTRLRMFWWGTKERADRTQQANTLYEATHPGVTIVGETLGWPDYWPYLAIQTVGAITPDLIQMDYRFIAEYARRGALLPLDAYMPGSLEIEDFGAAAIDSGRVDGTLYGISLGLNSTAIVYDAETLQQIGIEAPSWDWSWAQYGEWSLRVASRRDDYWGLEDAGGVIESLECWLRQRGKVLYTPEDQLGFDVQDVTEWFSFWHELRQRGAVPPTEILQARAAGAPEDSMLALGYAAAISTNSNQLLAHQQLMKTKLAVTMQPSGGPGAKPGQYLKPSMLWSVGARSRSAEEAVRVVDFYVTDLEAGKALGVERGVPASKAVREALLPSLDELGRAMVDHIAFITDKVGDLPPTPPPGAGDIDFLLELVNQQIGFELVTPEDGARQFVDRADSILDRG